MKALLQANLDKEALGIRDKAYQRGRDLLELAPDWLQATPAQQGQVFGCLPTINIKLLEERKHFELHGSILRTPWNKRTDNDKKLLKECSKTCA